MIKKQLKRHEYSEDRKKAFEELGAKKEQKKLDIYCKKFKNEKFI